MRKRQLVVSAVVAGLGAAAIVGRQLVRALPLVVDLIANDGGGNKKDDKKDMKKKGNGPRTQHKKEKKGKG